MKTKRIRLILGTKNKGKIAEWRSLLTDLPVDLVMPEEHIPDPKETGDSYEANAELKAGYYADRMYSLALAEDSGLDVPELYGFPGIYTARFADFDIHHRSALQHGKIHAEQFYRPSGLTGRDRQRAGNEMVLRLLKEVSSDNRTAYYQSAFAIARPLPGPFPSRIVGLWRGICRGRIAHSIRGTNGFGPDPIFIPDGQPEGCIDGRQLTCGEMSPQANARSHRHRTDPFRNIRGWLSDPQTLDRFGE